VGVFFRREVVLGNQLWGDGGFGHGNFVQILKINLVQDSLNAVAMFSPSESSH
jgi:hypothetical protein